jgi:hypothetical protein
VTAVDFCLTSAGVFFLAGLLAGAWKYSHTLTAPDARAPVYVDMAHRASLMYAFACALLAALCARNAWADAVNLGAAALMIAFFAATIVGYAVHGALRDTDNQLRRPHRLGRRTIPPRLMLGFMALLILGEIGGFLVILGGFVAARVAS